MKVTFSGNHLYKVPDNETKIGVMQHYKEMRRKSCEDAIIYGNDDYVHVIDGKEAEDFRRAEKFNKDIINQPYLFEALAEAYRDTAKIVDFTEIPIIDISI